MYSQENRELEWISQNWTAGKWWNQDPILNPSLEFLIQMPPPRPRWKLHAAQLHTSGKTPGWSPAGRAPAQNLCTGDWRVAAFGSSLQLLLQPPPGRVQALSLRSGRTPGRTRGTVADQARSAHPCGTQALPAGAARGRGEPRAHTPLQSFQQSSRFASLKERHEGRAGEAGAGPGGVGRGAWRAALARPGPRPSGFRRGRGSQTRRLAPGAGAKADAGY